MLENDSKAVRSVGKDVHDSGVENRDALISGAFSGLEDDDGAAGFVVAVAKPVVLFEGEACVGEVVERLGEGVFRKLGEVWRLASEADCLAASLIATGCTGANALTLVTDRSRTSAPSMKTSGGMLECKE